MAFAPPEGWSRERPTRYRHRSGALIRLTEEYGEKGWYIVPNNDDRCVRWFAPTPEGRDDAFRAFEENACAFGRPGPRRPDAHLLRIRCRNCGEPASFHPDEVLRSVKGLCESCYADLRP